MPEVEGLIVSIEAPKVSKDGRTFHTFEVAFAPDQSYKCRAWADSCPVTLNDYGIVKFDENKTAQGVFRNLKSFTKKERPPEIQVSSMSNARHNEFRTPEQIMRTDALNAAIAVAGVAHETIMGWTLAEINSWIVTGDEGIPPERPPDVEPSAAISTTAPIAEMPDIQYKGDFLSYALKLGLKNPIRDVPKIMGVGSIEDLGILVEGHWQQAAQMLYDAMGKKRVK